MSKKFLLPCSCGLDIKIEATQAGQQVVCSCGKAQTAPSMIKIRNLPVVEEERQVKEEPAYLRRTFFLLGIVTLIPTLLFLLWALSRYPKPADVSFMQNRFVFGQLTVTQDSTPIAGYEHDILRIQSEHIDWLMPMELFFYFQSLKDGPTFGYNFQEKFQSLKDAYWIRVTTAAVLVVLSLLSLGASFLMPKQNVIVTGWSGSEWN